MDETKNRRRRNAKPLVDIQLIQGVLSPERKKQMIETVTDTMVGIEAEAEAEAMRGVT